MARQSPHVRVRTFGIYSQWDSTSKELPRFLESTTTVPAIIDIEFGLVVNVVGGKNCPMAYCIDHPGIRDPKGNRRAAFRGEVYVKSNDWDFFLGDTIWEPIDDKLGTWRMTLELEEQTVADVTFDVVPAPPSPEPLSRRKPAKLRRRYRLVRIPI